MLPVGEGLPTAQAGATRSVSANSGSRNTLARTTAERARGERSGAEPAAKSVEARAAAVPDTGVTAYVQAARQMAAGAAGDATATADTTTAQVAAEVADLKATDAAVRAHEAAHVGAGGSYVRGAASFTYREGPDGKQYAVGGEVSIDTSPVAGNPQATILKMITVRAAAMAPADPSAADRAVAAAASRQEAAARAELLQADGDSPFAIPTEDGGERPDSDQPAAEVTNAQARQVRETYGAFTDSRTEAEPGFRAAA